MTELEFYKTVQNEISDFFFNIGYKKCKIKKGKRHSICFEKETEKYTIPIDIQFLGLINGKYRFSVHFTTVFIVENNFDPNIHWNFNDECDLKAKISLLKDKINNSEFIKQVEEKAEKYFN